MNSLACSSIKKAFLSYLAEETSVREIDGECVISIPIQSVDGRFIDVSVENKGNGYYLVHDSGKASDELFLQGISISEKRGSFMQAIALRFGVDLNDGNFVVGCQMSNLQKAIWSVGQASSLAMTEVLRHKPVQDEDAVKDEVSKIVWDWGIDRHVRISKDLTVPGRTSKHKFDVVCGEGPYRIAINILNPGAGSLGRAQRYGFQDYDLRENYGSYRKLAFLSAPPLWTKPAKDLVHKIADKTVEHTPLSPEELAVSLDELMQASA